MFTVKNSPYREMQIVNLHNLHWLACTCDDPRSNWSTSNLHASERTFFTVWPLNTSRRKLVSILFSFVRARAQGCTEMAFLLLALNLRLLASPFGHPSQVCVRRFIFPNLRWLATPFGQGLTTFSQMFAGEGGGGRSSNTFYSRRAHPSLARPFSHTTLTRDPFYWCRSRLHKE